MIGRNKTRKIDNVKCDVCGYQNHRDYLQYSGVCHNCGKILDERAYFKAQMNSKLRLWRNDRWKKWN